MKESIVKVTDWTCVKPFAGKVVAYQCLEDLDYFVDANSYYSKKIFFPFGLVSREPTSWFSLKEGSALGYNISKLVKKNAKTTMCALQTEQIQDCAGGAIDMRLATKQELEYIMQAIKNGEAQFANGECLGSVTGQINDFEFDSI